MPFCMVVSTAAAMLDGSAGISSGIFAENALRFGLSACALATVGFAGRFALLLA